MKTNRFPFARLHNDSAEYLLYPGQATRLGRAADCDIVLVGALISRSHAVLEWAAEGFSLRDMGSANGTSVNDQPLPHGSSRLLVSGDRISIGGITLVFEMLPVQHEPDAESLPVQVRGPSLAVSAGPDRGEQFPLWGDQTTIGRVSRDATWEVRLTDRSVSRPHARVERRGSGFILVDLGSANGTLINGLRVDQPVELRQGDVITVGETRLIFHEH